MPTGLQALLRPANADRAYLETPIERREAAADAARIPLSRSERSVLRSISGDTPVGMAMSFPAAGGGIGVSVDLVIRRAESGS